MAFTHIDCFSGPGGICTGMHVAGFDTKIAIEYIKSCVDTYKANHPEVHVMQGGQSSYRCNHHQHSTGISRNRCVWHTP